MVGINSCLNWHFLEYLAVLFPKVLPVVRDGTIENAYARCSMKNSRVGSEIGYFTVNS
jgi:hypothetical protein